MSRKLKADFKRQERCGIPEIIFGQGKSKNDLIEITEEFLRKSSRAIITRIDENKAGAIQEKFKDNEFSINYNRDGKVLVVKKKGLKTKKAGLVGIITAGTSDAPVAEEARAILEELGCRIVVEHDSGIAGIHRVFQALERMKKVSALIVIAGMEGTLPSIVAGLTPKPVIGVPTSIGYGTGKGGKAALNTMLNSCTPVAVVNIDNGYGAAVLAYKILNKGCSI